MRMTDVQYFTKEGLEELKKELHEMKTTERKEISNQIAEARAQGDLSENAEYDAAKEAQGLHEMRIAKLEDVLSKARILDESQMDNSKALILSKVRVLHKKMNKEFEYTLVSEKEADLKAGKISIKSPIGQGLLGKEVGDVAEIKVPNGLMEFEILEISR